MSDRVSRLVHFIRAQINRPRVSSALRAGRDVAPILGYLAFGEDAIVPGKVLAIVLSRVAKRIDKDRSDDRS